MLRTTSRASGRRGRVPVAVLAAVTLGVAAAGCGSDESGTAERLDAVDISGEVGAAPTLDWSSRMSAEGAEAETLVEGDGAALEDGDQVVINYVIGNGFTERTAVDTYGAETAGTMVTVGGEPTPPATAADVLGGFVAEQVEAGMTLGSRLAVTVSSQEAFGTPGSTAPSQELAALAEFDIGNADPLVFVIDLLQQPLAAPDGQRQQPAGWAPSIDETGQGQPRGLDFAGTPEPTDDLRITTLVEGTGEKLQKGDVMVADYLGQVYDADEPFDSSYASGTQLARGIGLGEVIPGWDKELVGVPIGSRVILAVPPDEGYGEQGNPQAGIGPTDTLYFLIDVLGGA